MAQGLSNHVPGPYWSWSLCPRACYLLSLVHHYCLNNGPGTIKQCPRPIILMIIMSQGHNLLSLVHYCCLKNVPGTIKLCPRSMFLMINMSQGLLFIVPGPSLLLEECPGTIKLCPRSIFTVVVWDVPGPSLLLEDWTRDYWNLSQVQFHSCQSIITGYHPYEHWENSISLGRTMIFPTLSWNTTCRYVRSN